jgi:hypothetical protein
MPTQPTQDDELAERLRGVALELKKSKDGGVPFVSPWRFDARDEQTHEVISCSSGECGCGISPDESSRP